MATQRRRKANPSSSSDVSLDSSSLVDLSECLRGGNKAGKELSRLIDEALHGSDMTEFFSDPILYQRDKLKRNFEKILVRDLAFAKTNSIVKSLWKMGFYSMIDGMRKQIAQKGDVGGFTLAETFKYKISDFLCEALGFFENLVSALSIAHCVPLAFLSRTGMVAPFLPLAAQSGFKASTVELDEEGKTFLLSVIYQCHLYMGDLCRYYHTLLGGHIEHALVSYYHSDGKRHYTIAAALQPNEGFVYNQLAVLLDPKNYRLDTTYYSFRCLMSVCPFRNIEKSLLVVLEEIKAEIDGFAMVGYDVTNTPLLLQNSQKISKQTILSFLKIVRSLYLSEGLEGMDEALSVFTSSMEAALICSYHFLSPSGYAHMRTDKAHNHQESAQGNNDARDDSLETLDATCLFQMCVLLVSSLHLLLQQGSRNVEFLRTAFNATFRLASVICEQLILFVNTFVAQNASESVSSILLASPTPLSSSSSSSPSSSYSYESGLVAARLNALNTPFGTLLLPSALILGDLLSSPTIVDVVSDASSWVWEGAIPSSRLIVLNGFKSYCGLASLLFPIASEFEKHDAQMRARSGPRLKASELPEYVELQGFTPFVQLDALSSRLALQKGDFSSMAAARAVLLVDNVICLGASEDLIKFDAISKVFFVDSDEFSHHPSYRNEIIMPKPPHAFPSLHYVAHHGSLNPPNTEVEVTLVSEHGAYPPAFSSPHPPQKTLFDPDAPAQVLQKSPERFSTPQIPSLPSSPSTHSTTVPDRDRLGRALAKQHLAHQVQGLEKAVKAASQQSTPLLPVFVIPDTNSFVYNLTQLKQIVSGKKVILVVALSVLHGLDMLKKGLQTENSNAREATRYLEKVSSDASNKVQAQTISQSRPYQRQGALPEHCGIISCAFYFAEQVEDRRALVAVVTSDASLAAMAQEENFSVISVHQLVQSFKGPKRK